MERFVHLNPLRLLVATGWLGVGPFVDAGVNFEEDFEGFSGSYTNTEPVGKHLRAVNASSTGVGDARTIVGTPHTGSAFAGGGNQVCHPHISGAGDQFAEGVVTDAKDYLLLDRFRYEVEFKNGDDGNSQLSGVYIGVGDGALRFNECPREAIYMVVYGDTTGVDGRVDLRYEDATTGCAGKTILDNFAGIGGGSTNIHRVIITWLKSASDLVFSLDKDNDTVVDNVYTVDVSSSTFDFLDHATESGLLFLGKTWVATDGTPLRAEFDNMRVSGPVVGTIVQVR